MLAKNNNSREHILYKSLLLNYNIIMAWRSSGNTNKEMVDNLKSTYFNVNGRYVLTADSCRIAIVLSGSIGNQELQSLSTLLDRWCVTVAIFNRYSLGVMIVLDTWCLIQNSLKLCALCAWCTLTLTYLSLTIHTLLTLLLTLYLVSSFLMFRQL